MQRSYTYKSEEKKPIFGKDRPSGFGRSWTTSHYNNSFSRKYERGDDDRSYNRKESPFNSPRDDSKWGRKEDSFWSSRRNDSIRRSDSMWASKSRELPYQRKRSETLWGSRGNESPWSSR